MLHTSSEMVTVNIATETVIPFISKLRIHKSKLQTLAHTAFSFPAYRGSQACRITSPCITGLTIDAVAFYFPSPL